MCVWGGLSTITSLYCCMFASSGSVPSWHRYKHITVLQFITSSPSSLSFPIRALCCLRTCQSLELYYSTGRQSFFLSFTLLMVWRRCLSIAQCKLKQQAGEIQMWLQKWGVTAHILSLYQSISYTNMHPHTHANTHTCCTALGVVVAP